MSDVAGAAGAVTVQAASALVVAIVGVEPQALVWAMVGSTLGLSLAKPSSRTRAVFVFLAASLACALLGTLAAGRWFDGSSIVRNTLAMVIAVGFHPALSSYLEKVPALVAAVWDRIFQSRPKQ